MQWKLVNSSTGAALKPRFPARSLAEAYVRRMGHAFSGLYEAQPETKDPWMRRVLTEGLVQGDLRRIILPQISVDEYVPGDPSTDNIVIAFFIKGVPEAVIPFRDFIMKCPGVIDVAYGDSDTIPDASIVYAEIARETFRFDDLHEIMDQVALLSDMEVADFSLRFPNTTKRYPYSEEAILDYFRTRSRKKNWLAQQKALDQQEKDQRGDDTEENQTRAEEQNESLIETLVSLFPSKRQ